MVDAKVDKLGMEGTLVFARDSSVESESLGQEKLGFALGWPEGQNIKGLVWQIGSVGMLGC